MKQAYANLATVIEALGARDDQVVKLTVFVVDHDMSKLCLLTENVTRMFGATLPAQTLQGALGPFPGYGGPLVTPPPVLVSVAAIPAGLKTPQRNTL